MTIYKTESGEEEVLGLYRTLLDDWPVGCRTAELETSFGTTFAISSGIQGKPVIVLLHGTGSNSASWMADIKVYSKDYLVHCIDIPGEAGFSSRDRFSLKEPELFCKWLQETFTKLNIKKAHIIGQSLGGWIGLHLCQYNSGLVSSLSLISPSGICQPRGSYLLKLVFYLMLGSFGQGKIIKMMCNDMEIPPVVEKFIKLTFRHFKFRSESPNLLTDEELKSIKVPVYYIAGEKDALLDTTKTVLRLKGLVSGSVVEIEPGGHVITNSAKRILSFLDKTRMEVC